MHNSLKIIAAGLAALSAPLAALPASAQQAESTVPHYSVEATHVGTLLDDPAAAKVLEQLIPSVYSNDMFKTMGRNQTLKAIQQYEPEALSDHNLARIQAEFDKLAAKKK